MAADGTGSGANNPVSRNQVMTDTLKIIGTSLLGLSIQCAQCHDHRYDPIPQSDYYAVAGRLRTGPGLEGLENSRRPTRFAVHGGRSRTRTPKWKRKPMSSPRRAKRHAEYMKQAIDKELMKYRGTAPDVSYARPIKRRTQNAPTSKKSCWLQIPA